MKFNFFTKEQHIITNFINEPLLGKTVSNSIPSYSHFVHLYINRIYCIHCAVENYSFCKFFLSSYSVLATRNIRIIRWWRELCQRTNFWEFPNNCINNSCEDARLKYLRNIFILLTIWFFPHLLWILQTIDLMITFLSLFWRIV